MLYGEFRRLNAHIEDEMLVRSWFNKHQIKPHQSTYTYREIDELLRSAKCLIEATSLNGYKRLPSRARLDALERPVRARVAGCPRPEASLLSRRLCRLGQANLTLDTAEFPQRRHPMQSSTPSRTASGAARPGRRRSGSGRRLIADILFVARRDRKLLLLPLVVLLVVLAALMVLGTSLGPLAPFIYPLFLAAIDDHESLRRIRAGPRRGSSACTRDGPARAGGRHASRVPRLPRSRSRAL